MPVAEVKTRVSVLELFDWLEYWRRVGGEPSEAELPALADLTTMDQLQAALG